jgi:fatty acid-binding protein DegV
MPSVHLVCDSTADLDPAFRAAHTVRVVPLKVIFSDQTYLDGVDISAEEFYKRLAAPGPFPRTSQPTPGEFEDVFRELGSDGGAIVCTTISADLSGTYASATQARAALPDLDIRVIDTRSVAVGHYAAVREAVRVIESGGDADRVEASVAAVRSTEKVPILEIRDGVIEAVGRVRTYPRAIDRVVEECKQAAAAWGGAEVVVAHADRPRIAAELVERMRPLVSGEPALTVVGPVVGCHSGPGAIGVGFHKPIA